MTHAFELTLINRATEIARAHDQLEQFAATHEVPVRKLHELQLALEEHLTNILRYGYDDDREHHIQIGIKLAVGELRVEVQDDGRAFNPLTHSAPDLSLPLAERPIGGLGIHMIRKSVDQLDYRREDDKNVLVLTKRL